MSKGRPRSKSAPAQARSQNQPQIASLPYDEFRNEDYINDNISRWLPKFIRYKDNLIQSSNYRENNYLDPRFDDRNINPTVSINLRVVLSLIIDKCHDFIETPQFVNEIYWKYSVLFIIQVNYPTYIYYDTGIYKNVFTELIRRIIEVLVSSSNIHSFLSRIQSLYDEIGDFLNPNKFQNSTTEDIISNNEGLKSYNKIKNQYKIKSLCYSISGTEKEQYLKPIEANPYSLYDSKYLVDTNIGSETTYCNVFNMLLTNDNKVDNTLDNKAYVFSTIDAVNAESSSDTLGLLAYRNICDNMIPLNTIANQVDASQKSAGFKNMYTLIKEDTTRGALTNNAVTVVQHAQSITSQEIKLVDMTNNTLFFTTTIEKMVGSVEITIEDTRKVISDLVGFLLDNNGDTLKAYKGYLATLREKIQSYFSDNNNYNVFCHNFRTALHNDFTNYDDKDLELNSTNFESIISNLSSNENHYLSDSKEEVLQSSNNTRPIRFSTRSVKSNDQSDSTSLTMEDYFNVLSNHGKRNKYSGGSHFPSNYRVNDFYKIEDCFNRWISTNQLQSSDYDKNLLKTLFYLSFILFQVSSANTLTITEIKSPNIIINKGSSPEGSQDVFSPSTAKDTLIKYQGNITPEILKAVLTEASISINRLDENESQDTDELKDKLEPRKFKEIIKEQSTESENDFDVVIYTKIVNGSELLDFKQLLERLSQILSQNNILNSDTYATVETYGNTTNPSVANISQRIRDILHMYYGVTIEENVKTNRKTGASLNTQLIMLELFHKFLFVMLDTTKYDEFVLICKLIQCVMEQKTMCDISQSLCSVFVNKYPMLENGFASLLTFDTSAACVMRELWQIQENYHLNISFIFTKPTPFIFPPNSFIPLFNALSYRKMHKLNEGISVNRYIQDILYFWKELLGKKNDYAINSFISFINTAYNNPKACEDYLPQLEPKTPTNIASRQGSQETNYSDNGFETGSDSEDSLAENETTHRVGPTSALSPTAEVLTNSNLTRRISDFAGQGKKGGRKPKFTRRKNKNSSKRKTIKKRKMPKRKNKTRRNK